MTNGDRPLRDEWVKWEPEPELASVRPVLLTWRFQGGRAVTVGCMFYDGQNESSAMFTSLPFAILPVST